MRYVGGLLPGEKNRPEKALSEEWILQEDGTGGGWGQHDKEMAHKNNENELPVHEQTVKTTNNDKYNKKANK